MSTAGGHSNDTVLTGFKLCGPFFYLLVSTIVVSLTMGMVTSSPARAAGRDVYIPDVQFQPIRPTNAITIRDAVEIAVRNHPSIAQRQFKLRAAKANIALAKTQYLPNLNVDVQESGVTGNRIASVVMNNVSGFDTVPVDSGPPAGKASYKPECNNLQGCNLNWLLIDNGLRKANDRFAYADARTARADLSLTKLDVAFQAADAFLDAVASKQVIKSTTAALEHMQAADFRAKTLVSQGLRPAVDAADWNYEVAKAKIELTKSQRDARLCLAELAEKMGVASADIDIISDPLVRNPVTVRDNGPFNLNSHPLALLKSSEVARWQAKQKVLDVAYRPHLWLNSSVWGRGSGSTVNPIKSVAGGAVPQVFNYMFGVSYSFPILEVFPLRAQKAMARANELAARADLELALQILEKKDVRARIMLAESRRIAEQTPLLVEAARVREIKVFKRYSTGLTNMVSLAEAEKALAQAEVDDARAQVDVWKSILSLAYVQGDMNPFMQVVDIVEGSTTGR